MTIRFYKFLIVLGMIFFAAKGFAQKVQVVNIQPMRADNFQSVGFSPWSLQQHSANLRFSGVQANDPLPILASDHYIKNLAFFCRQEIKFEKAVRIPLRFRMGSLEQCNMLEGK